jgi:hypothetical protein
MKLKTHLRRRTPFTHEVHQLTMNFHAVDEVIGTPSEGLTNSADRSSTITSRRRKTGFWTEV